MFISMAFSYVLLISPVAPLAKDLALSLPQDHPRAATSAHFRAGRYGHPGSRTAARSCSQPRRLERTAGLDSFHSSLFNTLRRLNQTESLPAAPVSTSLDLP